MNKAIVRRAVDWAHAHPEQFDLEVFYDNGTLVEHSTTAPANGPPCGTTACVAGIIAFQQAPINSRIGYEYNHGSVIRILDGEPIHVADFAAEVAELTDEEINQLFYQTTSLTDVDELMEEWGV